MNRIAASLSLLLLPAVLAGCGQSAKLKPAPGHDLPVAPHGQDYQPSAEQLLQPDPQASPERSVELRRRSEEREDDPFDLPPEN